MDNFLLAFEERLWHLPEGVKSALDPTTLFIQGEGAVPLGLQVAVAEASKRPKADDIRAVWKKRLDGAGFPLMLVVAYPKGGVTVVAVCGPAGESPKLVFDVDPDQVERVCAAALRRPDRVSALRFLSAAEVEEQSGLPGIRNVGLFATWELAQGVPQRSDWSAACQTGKSFFKSAGRQLVESLGFGVTDRVADVSVLTTTDNDQAVAVFLEETESFDSPGERFHSVSPVAHALAAADRESLDWVMLVRGSTLRLYPAKPDVGVGRRGRAGTYVEANLDLLPPDQVGYLSLLFSADALSGGSVGEILTSSSLYVAGLGERLRDRIYFDAVPTLATALANKFGDTSAEGLTAAYGRTMAVLFRLLFVAYGEDKELLPYRTNGAYADKSLTALAKLLAAHRIEGESHDPHATDLWDQVQALWSAIEHGREDWDIPPYGGTLFSSDAAVNPDGAALGSIELTNEEFGPTLSALLVDEGPDGLVGPVDFRSLSVREFGTIYEGLLESELSVAQSDLTEKKGQLEPAAKGADVAVGEGEIYFHNRSGARKSSGSYFTKPFAVEHLLNSALAPAMEEHLERVKSFVDSGDEAAAAKAFLDFKTADIAMGSGHFLVAAIDHLEARFSRFLTEHPIPAVNAELDALRKAATNELGKHGLSERYQIDSTQVLRRLIARRCIYGVDINPVSVELARLAIWIHTFVPGLPLSFLDHNLVVGNSLTGIGTLDEVSDFLEGGLAKAHIDAQIEAAQPYLDRLTALSDATIEDISAAREASEEARQALQPVTRLLDMLVLSRAGLAEIDPLFLTDKEVVTRRHANNEIQNLLEAHSPLHFPVVFPEVFRSSSLGFNCILGNPPWEEVVVEELAFWNTKFPGIKALSSVKQREEIRHKSEERPDLVIELDAAKKIASETRKFLTGRIYPGMGTGDTELYKAFCWRFWMLCRWSGDIGIILPRSVFVTSGSSAWRCEVLPSSSTEITFTKNTKEWLFNDVNPGWPIALVSISPSRETQSLSIRGTFESKEEYELGMQSSGATVDIGMLQRVDELLCIPSIDGVAGLNLFSHLLKFSNFSDDERQSWKCRPMRELDVTNDKEAFFTNNEDGYPIYNHLNIGHFAFEESAGAFNYTDFENAIGLLQTKRKRIWGNKNSAFTSLPREWSLDLSTLPALNPRIAFRDVIHAGNERKVWASLVPSQTILTNTAPYFIFSQGGVREQAFVLGLLNSSILDWIGHTKINLHLNYFILNSFPMPEMLADAKTSRFIELSAGLAIAGSTLDRFGNWPDLADPIRENERPEAIAELDAIASLLYELPDEFIKTIWNKPTRPEPELIRTYRAKWRD